MPKKKGSWHTANLGGYYTPPRKPNSKAEMPDNPEPPERKRLREDYEEIYIQAGQRVMGNSTETPKRVRVDAGLSAESLHGFELDCFEGDAAGSGSHSTPVGLDESHTLVCTEPWLIDSSEVFCEPPTPGARAGSLPSCNNFLQPSETALPDPPEPEMESLSTDESDESSDEEGSPPEVLSPQLTPEERRAACLARMKTLDARKPPSLSDTAAAIDALRLIVRPPRGKQHGDPKRPPNSSGMGYKDSGLSRFVLERVSAMKAFLELYRFKLSQDANTTRGSFWMQASLECAHSLGKGMSFSRSLRKWARRFIQDKHIPENPYGAWTKPHIDDESFRQELLLHLQSVGKYVRALDIVHYLESSEVQARWGLKKTISLATAQRWMKLLGYRWRLEPKGQYADGHERDDVVRYRQDVFIPMWTELESRMRDWSNDGEEIEKPLPSDGRRTVVWFHDESIFYENDRRKKIWWHESETPKPYKKGEGASLMAADFFTPDKGWLKSADGAQSARVLFKPGKNRDGYFDCDDVLAQAGKAMDIFDQYKDKVHVVVYDNAKTHKKRAEGALSARNMPKNIPKDGLNWGVEVAMRDASGRPVHAPDGSVVKIKVQMHGARFRDGREQPLYFPPGHPHAGKFKGMAVILEERGYGNMSKVRAECKGFKCSEGATRCCCRRMLFNEPDFTDVESLLEAAYKARGYTVIFLPKFHCELNPIEQCWGFAKSKYRLNPPTSKANVMEAYVTTSLDCVPLKTMRRFATRSRRFIDAYRKGLNGKQAAWAGKKYHSHRTLPASLMSDLDTARLT